MKERNFEGLELPEDNESKEAAGGIIEAESGEVIERKSESRENSRGSQEQELEVEKPETRRKLKGVMNTLDQAARSAKWLCYDDSSEERKFRERHNGVDNLTDEEAAIVKESAELINSAIIKLREVYNKYK